MVFHPGYALTKGLARGRRSLLSPFLGRGRFLVGFERELAHRRRLLQALTRDGDPHLASEHVAQAS